ncbi:MAG: hypothetical protein OEP95_11370, partial [Myxococcales bacterium]|nr:hypothetical protein [Myxococcales bacterium]
MLGSLEPRHSGPGVNRFVRADGGSAAWPELRERLRAAAGGLGEGRIAELASGAMPHPEQFAPSPEAVGIDPEKLEALFERAAREVEAG